MEPWLLHPIPYGQWFLVVTDNARHFYYNQESNKSYWQLSDVFEDTTVNKDEFLKCLDFDQVAVLMAKVRGLKMDDRTEPKNVLKASIKTPETDDLNQDENTNESVDDEAIMVKSSKDSDSESNEEDWTSESVSSQKDQESTEAMLRGFLQEEGIAAKPNLLEGYSSDSDSDSDDSQLDTLDLDLNVPVADREQFLEMLSSLGDTIDKMDPWFLVKEELAGEFAQDSRYFSVTVEKQREQLYNEWVQENVSENEPTGESSNPSQAQSLFNFLLQHKKAIKKSHYQEFLLEHAELADLQLPPKLKESLFRQFKVMLLDQEEYERSAKKKQDYDPATNLKRERLQRFLQDSKFEPATVDLQDITGTTDFEKWVSLCKIANVPERIHDSPYNFVVGDEKRWEVYKQWIMKQ